MASPTRQDLETAARRYFDSLAEDLDRPRKFDPDYFEQDVAMSVELGRDEIERIDVQLIGNDFSPEAQRYALALLNEAGLPSGELDEGLKIAAAQLVSRAVREQMLRLIHQLTTPSQPFSPTDQLFAGSSHAPRPATDKTTHETTRRALMPGQRLGDAIADYLRMKKAQGVGQSQQAEVARALRWLQEAAPEGVGLAELEKDFLRGFRDDLTRINVKLRGRDVPFSSRLTNVAGQQITSATALRYWKSVQAFTAWSVSEGLLDDDPAASLKMQVRMGEQPRKTEPFSQGELRKLFATPLFGGYQSAKRLMHPGVMRQRNAHWWAAILALHTGLRAGELSQLLPGDFLFDAEVPHLKVRQDDGDGNLVKRTKSLSATRDLPLVPTLMTLGLRQFVEGRASRYPKRRVFAEFRLGSGDRLSDGMTRFWGDLLKRFGLWKPGRATHVFRHTVADRLRAGGAIEEDIGALLGHSGRSVTSRYGGTQPLERKMKTLNLLDFGFDVVGELGGPYSKAVHS